MPLRKPHYRHPSTLVGHLMPSVCKIALLCLLSTPLFSLSYAENSKPKQPINVFTTPWSRLFSGSEASFSTALTYTVPLERQLITSPTSRNSSETSNVYNQQGLVSLQYSPLSSFFANTTLRAPLRNINKYSSSFSYSFGYDDWHPGTFSLIYSNYSQDNHFFPQAGEPITAFEEGTFTGAYKFQLPDKIEQYLLINKEDSIGCQVGYSYNYRYFDSASSSTKGNKNVLLASCGYTLKNNYFFRLSSFYYPDSSQQQPWSSDYNYSIGYVSSYKPGAISIRYDNYSATRYPWRSNSTANFRSGTISISWSVPW